MDPKEKTNQRAREYGSNQWRRQPKNLGGGQKFFGDQHV